MLQRPGPGLFSEALEIIIAKLLRKNPVERYQTARELAGDLERAGRGESVQPFYVSRAAGTTKAPAKERKSQSKSLEGSGSMDMKALTTVGAALVAFLSIGGAAWLVIDHLKAPVKPLIKPKELDLEYVKSERLAAVKAMSNIDYAKNPGDVLREKNLQDPDIDMAKDPVQAAAQEMIAGDVSNTAPKSLSETAPYFIKIDHLPQEVSVYHFPDDVVIGSVGVAGSGETLVRGIYKFPPGKLNFTPGKIILRYPEYLKRFRHGEIRTICISNIDNNLMLKNMRLLPDWEQIHSLTIRGDGKKLTADAIQVLASASDVRNLAITDKNGLLLTFISLPWIKKAQSLYLESEKPVTPLLEEVKDSPSVVELAFFCPVISDRDLQIIVSLPNLENLNFGNSNVTTKMLAQLSQTRALHNLQIPGKLLESSDLAAVLHSIKSLKKVVFDTKGAKSVRIGMMANSLRNIQIGSTDPDDTPEVRMDDSKSLKLYLAFGGV